jgi:lipopolysaccharide/colanic/teichoic acid biosynthesis glycosyltransferase
MVLTIQKLALPAICFFIAFHLNEAYGLRRGSMSSPGTRIARSFAFTALILFPLYLAIPSLRPPDRGLLALFVLLPAASLLYFSLRPRVHSSGARKSPGRNVLVIGRSAVARAAARELESSGYTVIRFTESEEGGNAGGSLRTISRTSEIIEVKKPVRIVVCLRSPLEELPLRELFEQQIGGVPVETGHEAYERLTGKIFLDERTPLHLLLSHAGLSNRAYATTKRFVSAGVAAMALVVALPAMALIALSIYVTDGGPLLFVQERVGLQGRPFRLLKFRSMRVQKNTSSEWERDNEERITPLGRWLRRLHLDELPQLWNILRGDMDLVGPRPHPVSNHELFVRSIPYYSLRSLVRPGLTGWAQVRQGYANDLPSEIEKMRYDLCAIARPSFLRDLWVLLATAKTVIVGRPLLEGEAFPEAAKTARDDGVAIPFGLPVLSLQVLARRPKARLASYPDESMVRIYTESPALASVGRQGFARLLAAVVILSIASATLRLIAQTWSKARPNPTPLATANATEAREPTSPTTAATTVATAPHEPTSSTIASTTMATWPSEPTSLTTAAVTAVADLASLDAAAARARAVVRGYEISNAKVLRSVRAKRIGTEGFADGPQRPRYDAEVGVEIPRGLGDPIRRNYFLTLQYVGSGEWQIERAIFATRD